MGRTTVTIANPLQLVYKEVYQKSYLLYQIEQLARETKEFNASSFTV